VRDTKTKGTRKGDRLRIRGFVTVYQGKGEDKVVLMDRVPNKWVDGGLKGLFSYLLGSRVTDLVTMWTTGFQMYLGTDTGAVTIHNASALTSPIGGAPGTGPDSTSGENRSYPSIGVWRTKYIAVWNAGAVSGTIGEIALYLRAFSSIGAAWSVINHTYPLIMVSRISIADLEMDAFSIDPSKSLTVEWGVQLSYE